MSSLLVYLDVSSVPRVAAELIEGASQMFGFTSNLVIELSAAPSVHRAYIKKDLSETTLDPIVQQLAMAAASRASACWLRRCVRATLAAKFCATSRVEAIRDGATFHDPHLEAVRRFTAAIASKQRSIL